MSTDEDRLWLVRPNVRGDNRIRAWLDTGSCAIGWREVGAIEPGTSRDELRRRLRHVYPTESAATHGAWMGNLDRFVTAMSVGDAVVTPDGRPLYLGRIASEPRYVPDHDEAHRRDVSWDPIPLDRHELSTGTRATMTTMLTVADLSHVAGELLG